jgi:hypothetical protein
MKKWWVGVLVTLWALAVPTAATANPIVVEVPPVYTEPWFVVFGFLLSIATIIGGIWFLWPWRSRSGM